MYCESCLLHASCDNVPLYTQILFHKYLVAGVDADTVLKEIESSQAAAVDSSAALQSQVLAKKAKNQKKKEKKSERDQQRAAAVQQIKESAGPSQREQELSAINARLLPLNLKVKEVLSDGNCLYRAVADQCRSSDRQQVEAALAQVPVEELDLTDFAVLRRLAAAYIRQHADSFAPFLGLDIADPEFESYCAKIEDASGAEWGGQLEVRALSECLHRPIHVYDATAPVVKMGEDGSGDPIIVTYHRHYYALGEHYNSVKRVPPPAS